MNLLQGKGS